MARFYTVVKKVFKQKFFIVGSSLWGTILAKEKGKPDTTEEVIHNVALATMALKDGNIEKSATLLLRTLDFAEANNFSGGIVSTCDLLSSLAIKLGDYDNAEILLNKALKNLISEGASEDDDYVVSFNLKLSRIYSSQGNDDLAELGFKNCLKVQQNKLNKNVDEETYLLWTTILYWYGKFLLERQRFEEAKKCLKDCYLSSLETKYLMSNQIMVILYNLGEVCETLGEHDEATEYLLKGVSLDKKGKNPDLTYFYSKLGIISMNKRLYKEAKLWCDQAQKFAVKHRNCHAERESNECLRKLNSVLVA